MTQGPVVKLFSTTGIRTKIMENEECIYIPDLRELVVK